MFRPLMAACVASLSLAFSAAADVPQDLIKSYNAARISGDPAQILPAARALAAAVIADPLAEDAGLMAFETAAELCLQGACGEAAAAAALAAAAEGPGLPPLAERRLLAAYAAWSAASGKDTLKAFDAALAAFASEPPTLISVGAFQARYVVEAQGGSSRTFSDAARRAADHIRPARDTVVLAWANAELLALTSQFNRTKDPDLLLGMHDLEYWLWGHKCPANCFMADAPEPPAALEKLYYTAGAWRGALRAYTESVEPRSAALRKSAGLEEAWQAERAARRALPGAAPAMCEGMFDPMPAPIYPAQAERRGYIGAVLVGVSVVDGAVENPRILAAVPDAVFEKAALESFKTVSWKFEPEQVGGCLRSEDKVVVPFVFIIR